MAISQDAFAKKMISALRRAGVTEELRYDAERFAVSRAGGELFLATAHQVYTQASFWRRGSVLKLYAQQLASLADFAFPKTFDEARGNVVPVVRNSVYFDIVELMRKTSADCADALPTPSKPIAGSLCLALAYDRPQALGILSAQQLAEWQVTFDDAMKAARYNLSVRSRAPFQEIAPGLFMGPWKDSNAAGRMVLTEVLSRLPVKGDVVVMAPGRDYLFVTGSDDEAALGGMVVGAETAVTDPKPNTPEMYRLRGTEWVPFTLPASHPMATRYDVLLKGFVASDYAEQKKLIEAIHEKVSADIYVASYSAMQRQSGEVYSWCSWAPCATLLPRTDVVAIFDADARQGDDKQPVMVPWAAAVEVVGHRMRRHDDYRLERYLVEESPTESEMAELRKRALPPG